MAYAPAVPSRLVLDKAVAADLEKKLSTKCPIFVRISDKSRPFEAADDDSAIAYLDSTGPFQNYQFVTITAAAENVEEPQLQSPLCVVTSTADVVLPRHKFNRDSVQTSAEKALREVKDGPYTTNIRVALRIVDEEKRNRFVIQHVRGALMAAKKALEQKDVDELRKVLKFPDDVWKSDTLEGLTYEHALTFIENLSNPLIGGKNLQTRPFTLRSDRTPLVMADVPFIPADDVYTPVYTKQELCKEVLPHVGEVEQKAFLDIYDALSSRTNAGSKSRKPTGFSKVFFKADKNDGKGMTDVPVFAQTLQGGDLCTVTFVPRYKSYDKKYCKLQFELRGITYLCPKADFVDEVSTTASNAVGADAAFNGLQLGLPAYKPREQAPVVDLRSLFNREEKKSEDDGDDLDEPKNKKHKRPFPGKKQ